ncbi:hypothetical protein QBC38DRAFT_476928 [Podospora fimiseda]|uniref:DUF4604 domain-containing protein n=1 Tax=Podospora fimiseda TaxID=252190 RepID=A0AAN7GVA8_9PEZI|nr:hypothetical protein QBC38DRAFT_476928 [Podospora fimiseda]
MSQKITAKNLQYSSNLPPFLARLRGETQQQYDSNGSDPILSARRRPVKPRSGSAEAEDAPTIVDEHGNVVQDVTVGVDGSVKEKPTSTTTTPAGDDETPPQNDDDKQAVPGPAEKIASIGVGKKRKAGKVIGGDADEEEGRTSAVSEKSKKSEDKEKKEDGAKSKPKKKAKKIKLSFGDEEG